MKNIFGSRFSMTWVNGNGDEFDLLLGHATSLGLNAIWVYHSTAIDPARLEEFCTAAVKRG